MICPSCKRIIADDMQFCGYCGTDISAYEIMYEAKSEKEKESKNLLPESIEEVVDSGIKKTGEMIAPILQNASEKIQKDIGNAAKKRVDRVIRDFEDKSGIKKKSIVEKIKDNVYDAKRKKRN